MRTPEFEIVSIGKPQTIEEKRWFRKLDTPSADAQCLLEAAQDEGWIYFIQSGQGAVKIGWTRNLKRRFQAHKVSNQGKLILLGIVPGSQAVERQFYDAFAEFRMRGEWFRRNDTIGRISPFLLDQGLRPFATNSRNSPEVPSLYCFSGVFTGCYEL